MKNMSERIPISQWRAPEGEVLEGNVFPSGQPPFYPFPTVSDVITASFCPRAIFQRVLHGVNTDISASRGGGLRTKGLGTRFHEFIAYLKTSIAEGDLTPPRSLAELMSLFRLFVRDWEGADNLWRFYLQDWGNRKFEELRQIIPNARTYFETTAASLNVRFNYEGEEYEYPLEGIIDELDLDGERIIERTIRGRPGDDRPPAQEAYQAWLLWKILCSIDRNNRPEELRNVDFTVFNLIVETPFENFDVETNNPDFERQSLDAYTWIPDITTDWRAEAEARRSSACGFEPDFSCPFSIDCYGRIWQYPEARPRMRRSFREFYRPLLWEIMWTRDLLEYQLLAFPSNILREMGILFSGRVASISRDGREVEIEAQRDDASYVSVFSRHEGVGRYTLIFGTPSLGQRVEASFSQSNEDRLIMRIAGRGVPISQRTLILSGGSGAFFESKPWFLNRLAQYGLFRLQFVGRGRRETAMADSLVQLMESLFGQKALRRERNERLSRDQRPS